MIEKATILKKNDPQVNINNYGKLEFQIISIDFNGNQSIIINNVFEGCRSLLMYIIIKLGFIRLIKSDVVDDILWIYN